MAMCLTKKSTFFRPNEADIISIKKKIIMEDAMEMRIRN